ncbi:hypothetical protein EV363DRAFT_1393954 [Boletus edulis]|uniref:Uncharacterized protein n=1 Tax=Boletus edulis BED1 TaxID=1328754 RepID=A0AAD4GLY4_BOLED|nr:hypothetical protein EV363DRAFT_1393954 [Boletus edulis]KAF8450488.1 hypothetical protein L210DRAFT_2392835 [Boletus edulis BED1]
MDTRRIPLQDLPLEQFLTSNIVTGSKTPRKHKRPLSPSRTTPLNPAKRRVLDVEGIPPSNNISISPHSHPVPFMFSNVHTVTPTRPSRLGNGLIRNHGRSQGTLSLLSSRQLSPFRELCPKPMIESSTNPQSRHYPGFDIFRDSEHRRGSPIPRVILPSESNADALVDRPEEDKENVPLRRRAKKLSSKKRRSSGLVGSDASCFTTPTQTCKVVVYPERTPFSACQPLR